MLGNRIKKLRQQQNLSLKELSNKIDISISFLSDIENNRSKPSLSRLIDIANGLNTSVSFLLDELSEVSYSQKIKALLNNQDFRRIINTLENIDSWPKKDIEELITYIKVKNEMINSK